MTSMMTVSPHTPTTNPKSKPIKYCPICHDRVSADCRERISDLSSHYIHVARKHDDWSQSALTTPLEA